jgi:hypothetical protein
MEDEDLRKDGPNFVSKAKENIYIVLWDIPTTPTLKTTA